MKRQNTEDTFWQKVKIFPEGCWEWQGCCNAAGYGHFRTSERLFMAHRYAYESIVGVIPLGLEIDHLCRNTRCVNPRHLEVVTHRENRRESVMLERLSDEAKEKLRKDWLDRNDGRMYHELINDTAQAAEDNILRQVREFLEDNYKRKDSVELKGFIQALRGE